MAEFAKATSTSHVFAGEIEKSFSDKNRQYRHITLSNDMEIFLVSHPGTDKAACCCSVGVGSLQDPDEYQGLAHFLEHLLFMGTAEYPKENEYSEFLSINGGSSNAYTAAEQTVYYYDILADQFEESIKMFSSFFKCPLFDAESTEREMKAVNSENDKNLQSDMWRGHQMLKTLSREDHPWNKFSTGNSETLGGERDGSELGANAREACIAFHKKFYSSNIMKVCVYGKESLDQLQEWAEASFSGVRNQNCPAVQAVPSDPYTEKELMKFIEVVPVKDERTVSVSFALPAVQEPRIVTLNNNGANGALGGYESNQKAPLYHSNPIRYLSHCLGHEGQGSILHALKEKNWATSLSAGLSHSGSSFATQVVRIEFTEDGALHLDSIVACVFAYIGMLIKSHARFSSQPSVDAGEGAKDLSWAPQELYDMQQCNFRYKNEGSPDGVAINIANNMHQFPIEHTLTSDNLFYDVEPMQRLAMDLYLGGAGGKNYFSVENSLVYVEDKQYSGKTTLTEKWYGTEYNLTNYADLGSGDTLARWKLAVQGLDTEFASSLYMPRPNDLLPTDFSLKHAKKVAVKYGKGFVSDASNTPTVIANKGASSHKASFTSPYARYTEEGVAAATAEEEVAPTSAVIWYQPDHRWEQPKCQLRVKLWVPHLIGTATSAMSFVLGDLYTSILDELLVEDLYYAECARLTCSASIARGALLLTAAGYSHKIRHLLGIMLSKMKGMAEGGVCSQNLFDRVKDEQLRNLKNKGIFANPHQHAMTGTAICMYDAMFHSLEKHAALQTCTLAHFDAFCAALLQEPAENSSGLGAGVHAECFFIGNITEKEALSLLYDKIMPTLKFTPLSAADHAKPHARIVTLPRRTEYIFCQHSGDFNADEPNSAIQNIYMLDDDAAFAPLAARAGLPADDKHSIIMVAETFVTLLAHIMHEAAFNQLRTIEQLGYIVHVGQGNFEHNFYLRVIVQSSVMDAAGLDERVEIFLRTWYRDFVCADDEDYSDLPADAGATEMENDAAGDPTDIKKGPKLQVDGVYDSYVKSLCEKLLEPEHSLAEEANNKWAQIDTCRYAFDRQHLMVSVLEQLTFPVFKELFNNFIRKTDDAAGFGGARRKLSSQFYGKGTHFPPRVASGTCKKGDTAVVYIDNPAFFKATHPLEPTVFMRK